MAQLLRLSKKLLGFEKVLGAGIAFTIPSFDIISLKIFNFTFSDLNISVTLTNSIGFLRSGLSVPYFSRDSLYLILGNGGLFIFFPFPNSLNKS